jgi:hypothetical protein
VPWQLYAIVALAFIVYLFSIAKILRQPAHKKQKNENPPSESADLKDLPVLNLRTKPNTQSTTEEDMGGLVLKAARGSRKPDCNKKEKENEA